MIGTSGRWARMAEHTAIAEVSCGPPMTVTPTASTTPASTAAHRRGDEVAIDVAVEDRGAVPALERARQAHHREREAGVAMLGDRRVDQQNTLRGAHESLCAGSTQRVSSISTGQR
jgi:hypothetical protein